MKLSEMSLGQARDTMVELTASIGELVEDPAIIAFFSEHEKPESTPEQMMSIIKVVQSVLRDHYDAALSVLSVLSGESKDALNSKSIAEIVAMIKAVYDQDLKRFFTL